MTVLVEGVGWPEFVFCPQPRDVKKKAKPAPKPKKEGYCEKALAFLANNPGSYSADVAKGIDAPVSSITARLYQMEQKKLIKSQIGELRSGSGMKMKAYWVAK